MAVIFADGEINDYQIIQKQIPADSYIICADGGVRHAKAMGLIPKLIVGDMDSVDQELLYYYHSKGAVINCHPREKDEVDTELAIREAVNAGYKRIKLFGATGSRLDHTLANIHLLVKAANLKARAVIINEQNHISLVTPRLSVEITGCPGELLSLIPLTNEVTGVNSRGLKWELTDRTFTVGNPFGISNELIHPAASITVKEGMLLMIRVWEE
ncbi:MAG: thiamine diphosphokinase [Firmicutes bacterium]|nr:thiamine diphosphokinase [Bacillota bacterium]